MSDDDNMSDFESDNDDMDGFSESENMSGSGDEPSEDDKAIDLENQFYTATDEMEDGKHKAALEAFRQTVKMEKDFGQGSRDRGQVDFQVAAGNCGALSQAEQGG